MSLLNILAAAFMTVLGALVAANVLAIVGYAFHQHRAVDRIERKLVRIIGLFRLGVR